MSKQWQAHVWRRLTALGMATGVITAMACSEFSGVESTQGPGPDLPQFTINACNHTDNPSDQFNMWWDCGESVVIGQTGSGPNLSSQIGAAAAAWSLGHGLPTFSYGTTGVDFNVERHGTATYYCGASDPSSKSNPIHLYPSSSSDCNGKRTGTAERILLHEIGHKVGMDSWYDGAGEAGYSDHCAMALPLGGDGHLRTGALCATEVEEVLHKYAVRGSAPDWGSYFIDGALVTATTPLLVGSAGTAQVTHLVSDKENLNLSLCPSPWGDEGWRCLAVGSSTFTWSSVGAPSGAVSLSGAGSTSVTITGTTAGGVNVKATLSGSGGHQTTTGYEAQSFVSSTPVSVEAPTLSIFSGQGQTGVVNLSLTDSIKVRLTHGGSGVAGRQVTFAITSGGGSVSPTTVNTDASGYAAARWTMPATTGAKGASATVSGAIGSPAAFTATAVNLTAPTGFNRYGCNLYEGETGDTLVEQMFQWTAAAIPGWEVGMASSNNSALASVIGSGSSGQAFNYGPFVKGGFPSGNRYFFIRAVYGASTSSWAASSNNPVNPTSVTGCQW